MGLGMLKFSYASGLLGPLSWRWDPWKSAGQAREKGTTYK